MKHEMNHCTLQTTVKDLNVLILCNSVKMNAQSKTISAESKYISSEFCITFYMSLLATRGS